MFILFMVGMGEGGLDWAPVNCLTVFRSILSQSLTQLTSKGWFYRNESAIVIVIL